MRIRRFEADNMAEALRMIKEEFGPDAVILSVRDLKKNSGLLGFMKNPGVEVTAAIDAQSLKAKFARDDEKNVEELAGGSEDSETGALYRQMMQIAKYKRNTPETKQAGNGKSEPVSGALRPLQGLMLNQNVDEKIVTDLVKGVGDRLANRKTVTDSELKTCLASFLKKMGISVYPVKIEPGDHRILAFVGPTGSGKTTTIAKLAAIHAVRMKKKVALLTIDNDRIGAIEQMRIYAKIIGVPMETARDAGELEQAVEKLKKEELLLIDTPGSSPFNTEKLNRLKSVFEKLEGVEFHLIISAATKEEDLENIIEKFRLLPVKSVIFTKLDETVVFGAMINQLIRAKIPVSFLSGGQEIPEDIEFASIEKLADLLTNREMEKTAGIESVETKTLPEAPKALPSFLGAYVANKKSVVFHKPDCGKIKNIKQENILVFETLTDAICGKYRPCKLCCSAETKKGESPAEISDGRKLVLKK